MPNWVSNKVKFSGRGREILDKVITQLDRNNGTDSWEEELFDFEKIVPMPKELHLTSGGNQDSAIAYALSLKTDEEKQAIMEQLKNKDTKSIWGSYFDKFTRHYDKQEISKLKELAKQFKKDRKDNKQDAFEYIDYDGLGIKTLEDLGNRYIQNVLDYGFDTWYDWSCANWGTKWNSSNTYVVDDNNVEFDTAWSCPFEVLKALSKQYADIEIYVEYADEDLGSNCGYFTLQNGEIIENVDMDGDLEFAMEVKGYSEEEKEEIRNWNKGDDTDE